MFLVIYFWLVDWRVLHKIGECKKEDCYSKYLDPKGEKYYGCASTTVSGRMCQVEKFPKKSQLQYLSYLQAWNSTDPHHHSFTDLEMESNYCRNPRGYRSKGPWC